MTPLGHPDSGERLTEWREAFDRAFAEPVVARAENLLDFLAIRVDGQACALRLDELSGLMSWRAPTPYPLASTGLLGLINHQGSTLPLFDLQALLGRGSTAAPAWIVRLKAAPLALAFEGFDGQWRLPPEDRIAQPATHAGTLPSALLGDAVRCGELLRPLIDLAALCRQVEAARHS